MPTGIDKAIIKFGNHPSILLTKENVNNIDNKFSFDEIEINEVIKEKPSLNLKKARNDNYTPSKILKNCNDSCAPEFFLKN